MKLLILGLVQGTPSRSLACSYVTVSIKAKLLAYPPQVCFGFVCFCQILQGRGHWILAVWKCTISHVPGIILSSFSPHLAIASCCFSVTDPDKLITCHSAGHSCPLVTPKTIFLPNSGRQSNNYMSKMPVLLLSSRIRIQTKALVLGAHPS